MRHHVKLVKGDDHTTMAKPPKKNIVSLTVTLSDLVLSSCAFSKTSFSKKMQLDMQQIAGS